MGGGGVDYVRARHDTNEPEGQWSLQTTVNIEPRETLRIARDYRIAGNIGGTKLWWFGLET